MTLYLPTEEEAADGIGPWLDTDDTSPTNLSAFEQDRYARLLREHGTSPHALVNGSIGGTRIPVPHVHNDLATCVACNLTAGGYVVDWS